MPTSSITTRRWYTHCGGGLDKPRAAPIDDAVLAGNNAESYRDMSDGGSTDCPESDDRSDWSFNDHQWNEEWDQSQADGTQDFPTVATACPTDMFRECSDRFHCGASRYALVAQMSGALTQAMCVYATPSVNAKAPTDYWEVAPLTSNFTAALPDMPWSRR